MNDQAEAKRDLESRVRDFNAAEFQYAMAQWSIQRAYDRCLAAGMDPVRILKAMEKSTSRKTP